MSKRSVVVLCLLIILALLGGAAYFALRKPASSTPSGVTTMQASPASLGDTACPNTFMSWNIANFGESKNDEEIAFMARVLSPADIVAIQEVTAGKDLGAQTVGKLQIALSRTGSDWDCIISNPTISAPYSVERYAFCAKKHTVAFNRDNARLVKELEGPIDREPYALLFTPKQGAPLEIFTIHTVPTAKHPMKEVAALAGSKTLKEAKRAIVAGDLNLGPKDTDVYFRAAGYVGHINELTSLGRKVGTDGNYLAEQYDNVYTKGVDVCTSGVVDFVKQSFAPVTDRSLKRARYISDHLPVIITFR